MSDGEKNQHLSPILDDIQDFGPDEKEPEPPPEPAFTITDEPTEAEAEPAPVAASAGASRWQGIAIGLLLLLVLALAGLAGYQQMQLGELQQELGKLSRQLSSATPEAAEHDHPPDAQVAVMQLQVDELQQRVSAAEEQLATREAPAPPVSAAPPVEPGAATEAEAELEPVADSVEDSGAQPWFINLSSFELEAVAQRWASGLQNSPRPVEVVAITSGGRDLFRVRIGGFASRDEARDWAERLKQQWDLEGAWVSDR